MQCILKWGGGIWICISKVAFVMHTPSLTLSLIQFHTAKLCCSKPLSPAWDQFCVLMLGCFLCWTFMGFILMLLIVFWFFKLYVAFVPGSLYYWQDREQPPPPPRCLECNGSISMSPKDRKLSPRSFPKRTHHSIHLLHDPSHKTTWIISHLHAWPLLLQKWPRILSKCLHASFIATVHLIYNYAWKLLFSLSGYVGGTSILFAFHGPFIIANLRGSSDGSLTTPSSDYILQRAQLSSFWDSNNEILRSHSRELPNAVYSEG